MSTPKFIVGRILTMVPVLALSATACARPASEAAPAPAAATASSGPTSDGVIAGLFIAANTADIHYGGVATAKGRKPEVRQFGQTMMNDHGALNTALNALLERQGITAIDTEESLNIRDDAEELRDEMRKKDGAEFDRFYMDNEIDYHTKLLARMDREFIPRAKNAELKEFLSNVRTAVAAHLAHAKVVRKTL